MMCCYKKIAVWIVFPVLLITARLVAQDTRAVMDRLATAVTEKASVASYASVYLKTSKSIYMAGEDLWFSARVLDAQELALYTADKILFIQVQQRGTDSIIWQEMYPLANGISGGQVYLADTLPEGDYILKGYTQHSSQGNKAGFYSFAPFKILKDLRKRPEMVTQPVAAVAKDSINFMLFPEGGSLIAGIKSKVAFKAVKAGGLPAEVSGTLLNGDTPVVHFQSSHVGMGSFCFQPEKGRSYHIRLDNARDSIWPLPVVQEKGLAMRLVSSERDTLVFKIYARHLQAQEKIYLRLQIRGMVQTVAAGMVTDSLEIKMPVDESPTGIAEATLFNSALQPVAERLVYMRPEQQLYISAIGVQAEYGPHEKMVVKIKTTDRNGKPVSALLNLNITDQLFDYQGYSRNIASYYLLSTQVRGKIYDPAYYFDTTHQDRVQALDLLLLTQGWRCYVWNEELMRASNEVQQPELSDNIQAMITPVKKNSRAVKPVSMLLFNYNRSITRFAFTDSTGGFTLTPEQLSIGPRFFIKYVSENPCTVSVSSPFSAIQKAEREYKPVYIEDEKGLQVKRTDVADTGGLWKYGRTLETVVVKSRSNGFNNKYLGYLDSIARYEGCTDYVCRLNPKGYLNCPWCGSGTNRPVEGQDYPVFIGKRVVPATHMNAYFTAEEVTHVIYHYPKYTEEELLKKFNMAVTKGFYQSRKFYEPDYDKDSVSSPDSRNTLLWRPAIVTDSNGEATMSFFCSDIRGRFIGEMEGVAGNALMGVNSFSFLVK